MEGVEKDAAGGKNETQLLEDIGPDCYAGPGWSGRRHDGSRRSIDGCGHRSQSGSRDSHVFTLHDLDNLSVRVVGGNLELLGQVSQPYKKADLQRIVQRVPGVTSVTNEVEVLPLSFNDDNLRLRIARAIYREPALSRYAIQPVPPIHIIVKNGHVTLEGVVNNELEKNVAAMRASSAGLSFGPVQNNLRVENPKKKS